MKAVILSAAGTTPSVIDVPEPQAGPGELLVRVRASSANPIDGGFVAGFLASVMPHDYPITLGRDFAGTVEAVGEGVEGYAVGDAVLGFVAPLITAVHDGAWAELIALPASFATTWPASVPVEVAGAAAFTGVTAIGLVDAIDPKPGEVVLVPGATGGVGSLVVQLLAAAGATVVASAKPEDEAFLRNLGVTHVVARDGDVAAEVRALFPDGADALIDLVSFAVGAFDGALRPGARVASTLRAAGEGAGHTNVNWNPQHIGRVAALLADGTLQVPIAATYALADAPAALGSFGGAHKQGKIAIAVS